MDDREKVLLLRETLMAIKSGDHSCTLDPEEPCQDCTIEHALEMTKE